jgi:serine/threonine protein kinase
MPTTHTTTADPKRGKKKKKEQAEHTMPNNKLADPALYDTTVAPSLNQPVRVVSELGQFDAMYTKGRPLGLGAFAKVFLGTHKQCGGGVSSSSISHNTSLSSSQMTTTTTTTPAQYAIKKIDRSKMLWGSRDALEDEINNLILVRNGPNIVQLYEVYEEKTHCFLVMELMRGGELFDRILEQKTFSETAARDVCTGLLTGLEYMHRHRVAHRDLKPENLLLLDEYDETACNNNNNNCRPFSQQIKLADFGFAKRVTTENGCRTLCGTPGYLAPEILERFPSYDVKCDLWSVGVIVFLLLGGYLPFEDENEDRVFEKTREGQYYFHPTYWKSISTQAKNFVTHLLTVNPKKRYSSVEALKDPWMPSSSSSSQTPATSGASNATTSSAATATDENNTAAVAEKTGNLKVNIRKAKEKLRAAVHAIQSVNRLKLLNENFNGYLERHRDDNTTLQRVQTNDKSAQLKQQQKEKVKFVEDSATGRPFKEFYTLGEILGEGGYACVYRATHKRTKEVYAVKDIDTSVLEDTTHSALKDEIAALKLLRGGPFIIRIYDVFEEKHNTYMIMEECRGGDLLTRVTEKEYYTEREARKTCKILFQAMDYIHKKKVAHRDIKPENVLMVEKDDDHSIKIADFGFAKRVPRKNCLRTLCGTAQYVAPEVLDLNSPGYDHRADMWSVGVVVYILLGGYAPFEGPVHELAQVICKGDYCFHDKYWADISNEAKEMISSLLEVNPDRRVSAEEALQSKWMTLEEESLMTKDLSGAQANLQGLKKQSEDIVINPIKNNASYVSFTAALGTAEEVISKTAKRTTNALATLGEDNEDDDSSVVEDSSSGKPFETLYSWGKLIEQGEYFATREAKHNKSKETFSVKSIRRNDMQTENAVAFQDEISTLQLLVDCPRVVKLFDVFEEPDFMYIVSERLRGGELIDRINEKRYYTESEARVVAKNLLLAVEYCHNRRIANRNIKAENIMLTEQGNVVDVKLCDFGMAKRVLFPNALATACGTEGYVAPEILEHRPEYDVHCDMWSLGVVLYIVLGGYRPFRGEGEEIIRKIRYGEFKFHKRYWSEISDEAKILIARMLTVEPIGRITATAALQSDWIVVDDHAGLTEVQIRKKNVVSAKNKIKAVVNSVAVSETLRSLAAEESHFRDF